ARALAIGHYLTTLGRGQGKRLHSFSTQVGAGTRQGHKSAFHMPCEHIIEGRAAAIIGYMLQVAAGLTAKQLCGQMLRGALPAGAGSQRYPRPARMIEGVHYSAKRAMRCPNPH